MIKTIAADENFSWLEAFKDFEDRTKCAGPSPQTTFAQTRSQPDVSVRGGDDGPRKPTSRIQLEATRITKITLPFMMENLDKRIQMPALCSMAEVSMSQFYYLFKLATGFSPNDFLIHIRIYRSCELLQETDLRVKEVSAALGYHDPLYFSRVFKSVTGISPSHYRKTRANACL